MLATLTPDNKLSFHCIHCSAQLRIPIALAGVVGPCPKCGETITAPEATENLTPAPTPSSAPTPRPMPERGEARSLATGDGAPSAIAKPQPHPPRQRNERTAAPGTKEPLKSLRPAPAPTTPPPEPEPAPVPSKPVVRKVAATRPASTTLLSKQVSEESNTDFDTEGSTRPVKPWTRRLAVDASTAAHLVSRPPGAGASGSIYHQASETRDEPAGPPVEVLGKLSAGAESIDLNEVKEVSAPRSFFNLRDSEIQPAEPSPEPVEDEQSQMERLLSEADADSPLDRAESETAQPQLDLDAIEPYEDVAVIDALVAESTGEVAPAPLGLELSEETDLPSPPLTRAESVESPEIDLSFDSPSEEAPVVRAASPIFLDTEESALLDAPELAPTLEANTERISTIGRIQRRQQDAPPPETSSAAPRPISFLDTPLAEGEGKVEDTPIERPQSFFTGPRSTRSDNLQPTLGDDGTTAGPTVIQIDGPSAPQPSGGDLGRRAKESLMAASLAMGKGSSGDEQGIFIPRDYDTEEASEADSVEAIADDPPMDSPIEEASIEPINFEPEAEVPTSAAENPQPKVGTESLSEPEPEPLLDPEVETTPQPTLGVEDQPLPIEDVEEELDASQASGQNNFYPDEDEVEQIQATPFTEVLDDDDGLEPPALLPTLSPIDQPLLGRDYEPENDTGVDEEEAPLSMSEGLHLPKPDASMDFLDELDSDSDRDSSPLWKLVGVGAAALLVIGFSLYAAMNLFVDEPELGEKSKTISSTESSSTTEQESAPRAPSIPPTSIDVPAESVFIADALPEAPPAVEPIEMPATPPLDNTMETGVIAGETVAQPRPSEPATSEVVILPDPFAMMAPPNPDQLKIPPKPAPTIEEPQAAVGADAPAPQQTVIGQTIGASNWPAGGEPTPPANLLGQQFDENGDLVIAPTEAAPIVDAPDAVLAESGAEIAPITERGSMAAITPPETPESEIPTEDSNVPPLLRPIHQTKGGSTPNEDLQALTELAPVDGTAAIEVEEARMQADAAVRSTATPGEPPLTISDAAAAPAIGGPTANLTSSIAMPEIPSDLSTTGGLAADPPIEISDPSEKATTMLSAPRAVLDRFLATTTPEERIPFFYQHENYRADIEAFYASHPIRTFELPDVEFSSLGEDPDSDLDYYVFDVRTRESPSFLPVVVRNTASGPAVDWKAYRDFQGRLFAEFIDSDQKGPESFRVRVARASYFGQPDGDDFTTKDDYVCFRITPPYLDYERYAFVKKGTAIADQMQEICYWGLDPELIAVLSIARETFPHGVEHLVIQKIDGIGLIPPASGNYLQQ